MIDGTISNQPMIINAVCAASAFWQRDHWYTGTDAIPDAVIDKIAATPGFGRWVMRFALYGDDPMVEHNRKKVDAAFAHIPGCVISYEKYDGRNLPVMENPHHAVQAGIPSMALDQMTCWYGGEKGGHIGFSCAVPISAKDGTAIRDLSRAQLSKDGLDYSAAIIVTKRAMIHVALVVFDTEDEAQARGAYQSVKDMVPVAAAQGYGEYRSHIDFMDLVADQYDFNNHAQFAKRFEGAVDAGGFNVAFVAHRQVFQKGIGRDGGVVIQQRVIGFGAGRCPALALRHGLTLRIGDQFRFAVAVTVVRVGHIVPILSVKHGRSLVKNPFQ
jgi:4-cresol dehydrogenase (hydroxylating)